MTIPIAEHDYVIVGGGSAGCVLANRLSADPSVRVLLLEAGGDSAHWLVRMPKGFQKLATDRRRAWQFVTEAQSHRGRDPEMWPRGKMLGGTSAINGMTYTRGRPEDYDGWKALGNRGWGWAEMLRVFRAMEDHDLGGDDWRGAGGPLQVSAGHYRYPFAERVIRAGEQMGLRRTDDFNGAVHEGVGYFAHTIRNGRRVSAASAFLDPIRGRPNLTILTHAQADRLTFAGRRATGVAGRLKGRPFTCSARREVIVSAGALHSPKLLQLSGIGDAGLLGRLGIELVRHCSAVGQHMRDHVGTWVTYRLAGERGNNRLLHGTGLVRSVIRYGLDRGGILSSGPFEVGAFVRSDPGRDRPNLQLYFAPISMAPIQPGKGYSGGVERLPGFTVTGIILRPTSEGHVAIRSADPDMQIGIHPHWLANDEDRRQAVEMIRLIRRFTTQPAIRDVIGEETVPGASVSSDAEIAAAFDRGARTFNHATGTCRMGSGDDAVVDDRLRVRGIEGLRVADCSVMPTMISGNTNAPAMAIGWRAAEMIVAERAAATT